MQDPDDATSFAGWLQRRRQALDLTLEALAAQVGCAEATLLLIERGLRRPSGELAERLADVLAIAAHERPRFAELARVETAATSEQGLQQFVLAPAIRPHVVRPAIPLVGRASELAALIERLRNAAQRLICLVGPGGVGKTSLALHAAADPAVDSLFPHGVAAVLLAPVASAGDVALAIGTALAIPIHGSRPAADQLLDALRDRALLLVLDNIEHLLGRETGAALTQLVGRVLAEAPAVRILATSRERLRLREEWVIELGGLALPATEHGPRVDRAEAVRLFVDRAQRVAPDFTLNTANRAAVARICRSVDGIPLAIELAAAWMRALAPAEIAAEIARALDFLTTLDRDLPDRHRSMRSVLDHSWQLLDTDERLALARLSLFRGGCDRAAAEQIAATNLRTLSALIDKSLLRRETVGGVARYSLHEQIRQYAAERLAADASDQSATAARHTAYYAALLQRAIDTQTGSSILDARAALPHDLDNLRAAWAHACTIADSATLGAMARGIWVLYSDYGWLLDGAALFGDAAQALRAAGVYDHAVAGLLLGLQGHFLGRAGRSAAGRALLEDGLMLLKDADAEQHRASLTYYLAISELQLGRMSAADQQFQQIAEQAQARGDHFMRRWAEYYRSLIAGLNGDYASAETIGAACVAAWRELGYPHGEAISRVLLGEIARLLGRYDQAAAYIRESLHLAWPAHGYLAAGQSLVQLGALAHIHGELDEARYLIIEGVEILRAIGDPWPYGRALALLAQVEIARGQLAAARRACAELAGLASAGEALLVVEAAYHLALLFSHSGGIAEALALVCALEHVVGEHATHQRAAQLRADLERRASAEQRELAATIVRQRPLIAWLAELSTQSAQPTAFQDRSSAPSQAGPPIIPHGSLYIAGTGETLSPREVEVLRLLIAGAANPAIAATLIISRNTVKNHVASILQKLGVATRTQAALQGRALGLEPLRVAREE